MIHPRVHHSTMMEQDLSTRGLALVPVTLDNCALKTRKSKLLLGLTIKMTESKLLGKYDVHVHWKKTANTF